MLPPITTVLVLGGVNNSNSNDALQNIDSIILIYDLDRDETFFRLENHWLPLIERCYNGSVRTSRQFFFSSVHNF